MLPSIAEPWWLLLPFFALALFFVQPLRGRLPGGWAALVGQTLHQYLARGVRLPLRDWSRPMLLALWCLLAAMLAGISFGRNKPPDVVNLYARVLVLDLGSASDSPQLLAARDLIRRYPEVPTGVVAVTAQAFDVVPVTTDQGHLDRYLQVLTDQLVPVRGRQPERGLQRAALLLRRSDILAGQIVLLSSGGAPTAAESVAALAKRYGIWIVAPDADGADWRAYGRALGIDSRHFVSGAAGLAAIARDLDQRRAAAATDAASVRERRELTPWLITLSLPLWLLLFLRRSAVL